MGERTLLPGAIGGLVFALGALIAAGLGASAATAAKWAGGTGFACMLAIYLRSRRQG